MGYAQFTKEINLMSYDFTTLVDRTGMGAEKWEGMYRTNPNVPAGTVPLSVADMELKNPPELLEGLKEYLETSIWGYTGPTESYYKAVQNWMQRRHGFTPPKEWFVLTPGVVPALYKMVEAFTAPGDSVLVTSPVYGPFFSAALAKNTRTLVENHLILKDNAYEFDWEDFEAKTALPEVKLYIMSSPHNPIGRIWTRDELLKIADICLRNNVFILCDEIHNDLILPGYEHVSMGTFEEKYLMNCVICTAPSKTFNLAGFQTSNIFIPNPEYRSKIQSAGGYFSLNFLGYKACELAYDRCEGWLDALLVLLAENKNISEDFFAEKLPMIKVHELQGTYLQWLDFHGLGMDADALQDFLATKAYFFSGNGLGFGEDGRCFQRLNLACPSWVLKEALERLYKAVMELQK